MKLKLYFYLIFTVILLAGQGTSLFGRSAQMLYFKAPKDAPKSVVIYQVGQKPLEVDLKRNNFSKTFKLADGETVLRFLGAPLAAGEEFPEGAPSLTVPADYEKVLIMAFQDPSNALLPVRFKVINANHAIFGAGDRMFINFTDSRIVGNVGEKQLDLAGGSIEVVKDAGKPKEEYQVSLDRVDPAVGKPYTFIRQTWRQSSTRRAMIFIYSPAGSKRVTYYNAPIRGL